MSVFEKPLFLYRPPYGSHFHDDLETFRFMAEAGVRLAALSPMNTKNSFGEPYTDHPPIWKWFGVYDFSSLDRQIGEAHRIVPEMKFILTIDLNSPDWLARRQLIDSFCELSEISQNPGWEKETIAYLTAFIRHCESAHRELTAGYILACGRTLEWIENRNDKPGPLKCASYRDWCKQYDLSPELPPFDRMENSMHGFIRDPEQEQTKIQWLRFCNELTGSLAEKFIRTARKEITNGAAVGLFFGHTLYASAAGHNACERVFDRAAPDFIIGAACNSDQSIGGNGGFNTAEFMLKRRKISFLYECDRLTSTSNLRLSEFITIQEGKGHWIRWKNEAEDVAGFRREVGMALIHGFSFWPFNIWGGSYQSPAIRDTIRQCVSIWNRYAGKAGKSESQILFVADPESNYAVNMRFPVTPNVLGWKLRGEILPLSGIPFDTAHFNDLETIDPDSYKLIIFQNLFVMTPEKERILRKNVFRNGCSVLFLYAPGVIWNGKYDTANTERLCGIPFAEKGFFIRKYPEWTSMYLADVERLCEPGEFEAITRRTAIHTFSPGAAVWASENLLQIHHAEGGKHPVNLLRRTKKITELFSGQVVAENCESFTDTYQSPDTKLYLLE